MPASQAVISLPPNTKVVVFAARRRSCMDVGPGGRAIMTTMRVRELADVIDRFPAAGDLTVRF